MNIEQARFNMIEQQIRPWKVLDPIILDLMSTLPREQFVPDAYQGLAFADIAIPLGNNRFMLHPREEGRLLQAVQPKSHEKVLVVGSATGYVTALTASMANHVHAVEADEDFVTQSIDNLDSLNIKNVTVNCNDVAQGFSTNAPYDLIIVLGSMQKAYETIKDQLVIGGRMFCIIGIEPTMEAVLMHKDTATEWREESLFETFVPALGNKSEVEFFHF
jgi:protein-L-isoaspartate(D-aspartate) O-methyltransferase